MPQKYEIFADYLAQFCKFVINEKFSDMEILIEDVIKEAAPSLEVVTVEADVDNVATDDELWQLLLAEGERVRATYAMADIARRPAIAATRAAYKALGKEPNRYRPSSEALCRRLVKGMELYRINALVDIINLISVRSGYSIGGFDADKIEGDRLRLGAGSEGEPFEAIGRGELNIASLPIYRDAVGGIGTPTSDNERTKLDISTRRLLMCINIYGVEMSADDTVELTRELLERYCNARNICVTHYNIQP